MRGHDNNGRDLWPRTPGQKLARPGTVDEAPPFGMDAKATIIADAASVISRRIDAELGRRGDRVSLSRLVNVEMQYLAALYDAIIERRR